MPEISALYVEPRLIARHTATTEQVSRTVASLEEGHAPAAGDQITHSERPARRSKLPSLKSVANAVISVGVGAGAYRLGEFAHANLHRNAEPSVPAFVQIGNLFINPALTDDFHQFAKIMEQDPKTNETLQFLLNSKPDLFGNPLTIDNVGADYNVLTNTIGWNPKVKVISPNSNSSEQVGATSPLGVLTHESLHAQHASENLPALFVRGVCTDPNYDDKEERLTIEQTDALLANFPGEGQRFDHHIGFEAPADNLTDNSLANPWLNVTTPDGNATIDSYDDIDRTVYSKNSANFPYALSRLYNLSEFPDIATVYRPFFPNSFNNTNLAKLSTLAEEGIDLTIAYASARQKFDVPAKFIEADADYTRRVYDFAANLFSESGDKASAAPAPGAG